MHSQKKIAHPTVYHHLSQLSVDIQLDWLNKCRENSGVQMKLTQPGDFPFTQLDTPESVAF